MIERAPIIGLSVDDFEALCEAWGQPAFRAKQLSRWIYARRVQSFDEMTDLPAAMRDRLQSDYHLDLPKLVRRTGSQDTTQKFLFQLADDQLIETVLIPASPSLEKGTTSSRRTMCVSSQVGCAYGCKFCASGLDGWKRNLTPAEIVGQVLAVETVAGVRTNNIVFMGMGEPLANSSALRQAITVLNSPWGLEIGARHITVSTSGLVPGILELARDPLQVRLAISLHGATDAVRDSIMPVNRKYPLEELIAACREYCRSKKQMITFEYILIAGVNDSPDDAVALAELTRTLDAKVNLIPYNQVEGLAWERPSEAVMERFTALLRRARVVATLRREKGGDIAAACGQLRLQTQREKAFAGSALPN